MIYTLERKLSETAYAPTSYGSLQSAYQIVPTGWSAQTYNNIK
jgi:hypothetical protein